MAKNNEMKKYDFIEGSEFNGLAPKAMKGYSTGKGSGYSHLFRYSVPDALEVVSINALFDAAGNGEGGSTKPEVKPNDEQQSANEQAIVDSLVSGNKTVVIENGTINNVTIPEEVSVIANITGEVADGATISSNSSKSFTINNTSEEPVSVTLESNNTVYLTGKYEDIYLDGKSIAGSSSKYAEVNGTITVDPDIDSNISITANYVGENAGVEYEGENKLTISDGDKTNEPGNLNIYAPNATVELGGLYNEVVATVSENTLILKNGFHAAKLVVKKGNVFVNGFDIYDFTDKVELSEGCEVVYNTVHATQENSAKLVASSPLNGTIILDEDIELQKGRTFGIIASGKEVIDLNGHTFKCGDTRSSTSNTGSYFLRGSAQIDFIDSVGGGKFINNHEAYLIWTSSENTTVNIYGGEFQGYTHVLYAEKGTINVHGGVFKMIAEDPTANRDENGNYKFLLNCHDADYTSGKAKIVVDGGKFYEFNPAASYGEPGGPVSFLADGYKVVESVEDGVKVYEVVKE